MRVHKLYTACAPDVHRLSIPGDAATACGTEPIAAVPGRKPRNGCATCGRSPAFRRSGHVTRPRCFARRDETRLPHGRRCGHGGVDRVDRSLFSPHTRRSCDTHRPWQDSRPAGRCASSLMWHALWPAGRWAVIPVSDHPDISGAVKSGPCRRHRRGRALRAHGQIVFICLRYRPDQLRIPKKTVHSVVWLLCACSIAG